MKTYRVEVREVVRRVVTVCASEAYEACDRGVKKYRTMKEQAGRHFAGGPIEVVSCEVVVPQQSEYENQVDRLTDVVMSRILGGVPPQ